MELDQVIKARRSIRKFKSEPVPKAYIQEIIDAGRLAPSVSNIQSTRYVIIKSPEIRDKLMEYTLPLVKKALRL
jgi:nitroreductase